MRDAGRAAAEPGLCQPHHQPGPRHPAPAGGAGPHARHRRDHRRRARRRPGRGAEHPLAAAGGRSRRACGRDGPAGGVRALWRAELHPGPEGAHLADRRRPARGLGRSAARPAGARPQAGLARPGRPGRPARQRGRGRATGRPGAEGPPRRRRIAGGHRHAGRPQGLAGAAGHRREAQPQRRGPALGAAGVGTHRAQDHRAAPGRHHPRAEVGQGALVRQPVARSAGGFCGPGCRQRPGAGHGGRLRLQPPALQPRHPGLAPAGLQLQALPLFGGAGAGRDAGHADQRRALGRRRGLEPAEQRWPV